MLRRPLRSPLLVGVAAGGFHSVACAPASAPIARSSEASQLSVSTDKVMLNGDRGREPVVQGDLCVLEFGELSLVVNWKLGGRVTSARLADRELLSTALVNSLNFGSTFWTSPQADWHWPPVTAIDSATYRPRVVDATTCVVEGPRVKGINAKVDGISVNKTFRAVSERGAVDITYEIKNHDGSDKRLAPWEITRVGAGGLTFFAAASAPTGPHLPPFSQSNDVVWFRHDARVPPDAKLFADGKGWLAHVTPQNLLLLKTFPDITAAEAAPGEGEIEIFSSPSYVEVENQGAYVALPAGASSSWTVRWYLRAVPAGVSIAPGSSELLELVAQTLK